MPVAGGSLPRAALTSIAASSDTSVVTVGGGFAVIASFMHSLDGRNLEVFSVFNEIPIVVFRSQVQAVRGVRDTYVALGSMIILGDTTDREEGYAVTSDGGATWTVSQLDRSVVTSYSIAFGAFPTPDVWYMTGDDGGKNQNRTQPRKWGVYPTEADKEARRHERPITKDDLGGVYKSTDAGNTWQRVYWGAGISAQKITCPTTTQCWVTGKGAEGSECGRGCILHTSDGGLRWNIQLIENEEWFDWFDIIMHTPNEGFATGGSILADNESGKFYRTVDGGRTWTLDVVDLAYPGMLSIDRTGLAYTIGTTPFVTGPVIFKFQ